MGTVYRKTYTKPLPAGAELFTRKGEMLARWKDGKEKTRIASVTKPEKGKNQGQYRIVIRAKTFTAKYRNGAGLVLEIATGCRDETAARAVLAELVKRSEHVKSGILTVEQDRIANYQDISLSEHFALYLEHLQAKGVSEKHLYNVKQHLEQVAGDCGFQRLGDIIRSALESWMNRCLSDGMGARTCNTYRAAIMTFCNWCVNNDRLVSNPLTGLWRADERLDRRRQRRALTEEELGRLLEATQRRPLLDAMTIRRGKRKGYAVAKLDSRTKKQLELLGLERAMIYKTMVLTGLRKGELASLTVDQINFDTPQPYIDLYARDEKAGRGAQIPLRDDLTADLR